MKKKCAICNALKSEGVDYKKQYVCDDCLGYVGGIVTREIKSKQAQDHCKD